MSSCRPPGSDRPDRLLTLMADLPAPTVVGFEPCDGSLALHLRPIPHDERAGAAGLFGLVAPRQWSAVGVAVVGRARHVDTHDVIDDDVRAQLVVHRDGRTASTMAFGADSTETSDPAVGLLVDALHRMLGLPSPGQPPPPGMVALAVWAQSVVEAALERGSVTWSEALELNPGSPGRGRVAPSTETVLEATLRAAEDFDWTRMHRRASTSRPGAELTVEEAAWMDPTMFGRWVLSSMVDPISAVAILDAQGSAQAAAGLRSVLDSMEAPR